MPNILVWTGNYVNIGPYQLTTGVILMLALFAIVSYTLTRTAWGRHVYSIGDDAEAARLSGIKTSRVLLSVYVAAGVIYGIAAWILIGRVGRGQHEQPDQREPRQHHRRRDRRHQPVRRPRRGPRDAVRRADRADVPERPQPRRRPRACTRCWPREYSSSSPSPSTSGSGRYADERSRSSGRQGPGQRRRQARHAGHPGARGPRPGQDVRPRRRAGRGQPHAVPGRGTRHHRRQRRRQVDADQVPVRGASPGRGRDPAGRAPRSCSRARSIPGWPASRPCTRHSRSSPPWTSPATSTSAGRSGTRARWARSSASSTPAACGPRPGSSSKTSGSPPSRTSPRRWRPCPAASARPSRSRARPRSAPRSSSSTSRPPPWASASPARCWT